MIIISRIWKPKINKELTALVGGEILGDGGVEIYGAAGLDNLRAGVITLGATENAIEIAVNSPAAAVIVSDRITTLAKPGIRVSNPRFTFAKILTYFSPRVTCRQGIHPTAFVGKNFTDHGCQVGPLTYIGNDVTIGKGTILQPGAVIGDRVTIGEDSIIHEGVPDRQPGADSRRDGHRCRWFRLCNSGWEAL